MPDKFLTRIYSTKAVKRKLSGDYRTESVQQELEVYRHANTPDDFLMRLARLHRAWAIENIALDVDGEWLKSGDCEMRKAVVAQLREMVRTSAWLDGIRLPQMGRHRSHLKGSGKRTCPLWQIRCAMSFNGECATQ